MFLHCFLLVRNDITCYIPIWLGHDGSNIVKIKPGVKEEKGNSSSNSKMALLRQRKTLTSREGHHQNKNTAGCSSGSKALWHLHITALHSPLASAATLYHLA